MSGSRLMWKKACCSVNPSEADPPDSGNSRSSISRVAKGATHSSVGFLIPSTKKYPPLIFVLSRLPILTALGRLSLKAFSKSTWLDCSSTLIRWYLFGDIAPLVDLTQAPGLKMKVIFPLAWSGVWRFSKDKPIVLDPGLV